MGEEASADSLVGHNQHSASLKIDLALQTLLSETLSREGDAREIARFASVSLPGSHAGDWLTTVPSPSLGLLLKPQEFIAALRYRLGHPAPLVVNQVIVLAITPSTALGMVSELLDTIG